MFAPEVAVAKHSDFVSLTKRALVKVFRFYVDYTANLTLQAYVNPVVFSYYAFGSKNVAKVLRVDPPQFRDRDENTETYSEWEHARLRFLREYFKPYLPRLYDWGYVEGSFPNLVCIARTEE